MAACEAPEVFFNKGGVCVIWSALCQGHVTLTLEKCALFKKL